MTLIVLTGLFNSNPTNSLIVACYDAGFGLYHNQSIETAEVSSLLHVFHLFPIFLKKLPVEQKKSQNLMKQ